MSAAAPHRYPSDAELPSWIRIVRDAAAYESTVAEYDPIRSSVSVCAAVGARLCAEDVEVMVVLCLDGKSRIKHVAEVGRGGVSSLGITAREVYRPAVAAGATAIVLVHNHPSGDPTPSAADVSMTRVIVDAGKVLGIPCVDHVVIAGNGRHTSMLDRGLVDFT